MSRPLFKLLLAIVLAAYAIAPAFGGSPALSLRLTDGSRVVVGEISNVSEESLTVAAVGERIRIERTIPWSRIAEADFNGERYSLAELQLASGLKAGSVQQTAFKTPVVPVPMPIPLEPVAPVAISCCPPYRFARLPFAPVGVVVGVRPDPTSAYADLSPAIYPNGIPSTEAPFALNLLRERRRIETIGPYLGPALPPAPSFGPAAPAVPSFGPTVPAPAGDATLGDLSQIEARVVPIRQNGTADVNALGVELVGLDNAGHAVPVEGTAQLFLYAGEQRLVRAFDNTYTAHPEGLVRLAEWTRNVTPDATLILRLPQPLPEHNPNISPVGTLRVRLSAPGKGVFETLAEPVTLRPASALRENLRRDTGSRFLDHEKTSGSPSTAWPRQRDFSSVESR
jgi:hypothetical protein